MRQFATEDITEDLGISMRVRREARSTIDAIFVEDAQRSEVLEGWIVVVGEAESMVRIEPAVVGVSAVGRPTGDNLCVGEGFGHCGLDGLRAHRLLGGRRCCVCVSSGKCRCQDVEEVFELCGVEEADC